MTDLSPLVLKGSSRLWEVLIRSIQSYPIDMAPFISVYNSGIAIIAIGDLIDQSVSQTDDAPITATKRRAYISSCELIHNTIDTLGIPCQNVIVTTAYGSKAILVINWKD